MSLSIQGKSKNYNKKRKSTWSQAFSATLKGLAMITSLKFHFSYTCFRGWFSVSIGDGARWGGGDLEKLSAEAKMPPTAKL